MKTLYDLWLLQQDRKSRPLLSEEMNLKQSFQYRKSQAREETPNQGLTRRSVKYPRESGNSHRAINAHIFSSGVGLIRCVCHADGILFEVIPIESRAFERDYPISKTRDE
jgi:hypothetical protein